MKKILSVIGTRPEAIKMAPVIGMLSKTQDFDSRVCSTGQHRHMLDQVIELFKFKVDHDLNVMQPNQALDAITSKILEGLSGVMRLERPDLVLVQGDTTTTFVASLAAFYCGIPVGHIEAGLRTGDLRAPFPEEANRLMTARLASLHFAPTEKSRGHLLSEGISQDRVFVTGNTGIDSLMDVRNRIVRGLLAPSQLELGATESEVKSNNFVRKILVTGHRRENFGLGLENICDALSEIALLHPDWLIIFPVHLNPKVLEPIKKSLGLIRNILLIEPLSYTSLVYLLDSSDLVITDSGGIQEEAPSLGKPVLVTREVTERPEAVESGSVVLVGTNRDVIVKEVEAILGDASRYDLMAKPTNVYGDGKAAERIVQIIREKWIDLFDRT